MVPLAEMHLLLREAGWEPENEPVHESVRDIVSRWTWKKRGTRITFETTGRANRKPTWYLYSRSDPEMRTKHSRSVAALKRQLQDIVTGKGPR